MTPPYTGTRRRSAHAQPRNPNKTCPHPTSLSSLPRHPATPTATPSAPTPAPPAAPQPPPNAATPLYISDEEELLDSGDGSTFFSAFSSPLPPSRPTPVIQRRPNLRARSRTTTPRDRDVLAHLDTDRIPTSSASAATAAVAAVAAAVASSSHIPHFSRTHRGQIIVTQNPAPPHTEARAERANHTIPEESDAKAARMAALPRYGATPSSRPGPRPAPVPPALSNASSPRPFARRRRSSELRRSQDPGTGREQDAALHPVSAVGAKDGPRGQPPQSLRGRSCGDEKSLMRPAGLAGPGDNGSDDSDLDRPLIMALLQTQQRVAAVHYQHGCTVPGETIGARGATATLTKKEVDIGPQQGAKPKREQELVLEPERVQQIVRAPNGGEGGKAQSASAYAGNVLKRPATAVVAGTDVGTVPIKAHLNTVRRRFSVRTDIGFEALLNEMRTRFVAPAINVMVYTDDEGDDIVVSSDSEVVEMIAMVRNKSISLVRMRLE